VQGVRSDIQNPWRRSDPTPTGRPPSTIDVPTGTSIAAAMATSPVLMTELLIGFGAAPMIIAVIDWTPKGFEVISTSRITAPFASAHLLCSAGLTLTTPIESSVLSRRSCCRAVIGLWHHDVAAATLLAAGVSELAGVNTNGASCQPLRKM
jgi:hypothetical protein